MKLPKLVAEPRFQLGEHLGNTFSRPCYLGGEWCFVTGQKKWLTEAEATEVIRRAEAYPKLKTAVQIAIDAKLPGSQMPQLSIEKLNEITQALKEAKQ